MKPFDFAAYHGGTEKAGTVNPRVRKVSQAHWRAWWADRVPAMGAPRSETAVTVWAWVGPLLKRSPRALLPPFLDYCDTTDEEWAELEQTAQRALVVVLDVVLQAARDHQTVSKLRAFNALAAAWSPRFRQAQTRCPGIRSAYDMKIETVLGAREDLLFAGIRFELLWELATGAWSAAKVAGANPLYRVTERIPRVGLKARVRPRQAARFDRIAAADPDYRRPARRGRALLLADEPIPPRRLRQRFAGERPYNVVEIGERAEQILAHLESVRLIFNVQAFKADYQRYQRLAQWRRGSWRRYKQWKPAYRLPELVYLAKTRARRLRARRAQKLVDRYALVWGRVRHLDVATVTIHSGFFRGINRRFHAEHFWVEHVSGKPDQRGTSPRERWFAFERHGAPLPMVGVDVSASQTQILATVLGLRDLAKLAADPQKKFTLYLAEQAWKAHEAGRLPLRAEFTKASDLVPLVKELWLRHLYGSKVRQIVRDNPKWIVPAPLPYRPMPANASRADKAASQRRARQYTRAVTRTTKHLERFLASLPWYGKLSDWFNACARIGQIAQAEHPYKGVEFVDPFDKEIVRWNPIRRAERILRSGYDLRISEPGYYKDEAHRKFEPSDSDPATGDYRVSGRKLARVAAPMVVHMLDAAMSAHVVHLLSAGFEVPVVALHDAWLLPADTMGPGNTPLAGLVGTAVTSEWYEELGPFFERMREYLGTDPEFGVLVRRMERRWKKRKLTKDSLHFAVSTTLTAALP